MRSALVNAEAGPQPEDERTVLIPRPGVPPAGTVDPQRPAILVSVVSRPTEFDEAVVKLEAPLPRTQGLQLKKEIAAGARAAPAVTKRATGADAPRPQTVRRAPSRKWVLIGSTAGALVIAAAAVIPWLTAAPPNVREQERLEIEAAMGRFRTAYRNRNLQGVSEVFPTLPRETRQTMQRSFNNCLVYEVTFADMQVEMDPADGTLAQVDVRSTHTCTPNSGGRQTTTAQRNVFTLRKNGDTWLIDSAIRAPNASADRTQ